VFDQLTQVVQGDPPCLNDVRFSVEFIDFVNTWFVVCVTSTKHLTVFLRADLSFFQLTNQLVNCQLTLTGGLTLDALFNSSVT